MEQFKTFFEQYARLQLSGEEMHMIAKLVKLRSYTQGEYVFRENEGGKYLYIVKSGRLEMKRGEMFLAHFEPGDVFGEVALINDSLRFGSVIAVEDVELFLIEGEDILTDRSLPAGLVLKLVRQLARLVTSYLRSSSYTRTPTLIKEGEGEHVEFKSTLRYNIHTKKYGKEIEHASIKTIAAFLNSEGGTLLIGVDDKQGILGIEKDAFENDDKAMLHITNLVKERIGMHFMSFIDCEIELVEGKKIMRIDVAPASTPAYVEYNQQEYFFIRTGPATSDLKASEIYDYVSHRFLRK